MHSQSGNGSNDEPSKSKELLSLYLRLPEEKRRAQFLPTLEVSTRYGIPQRTIQNWIGDGKIDGTHIGRRWLVYLPSLKAYLFGCET